MRPNQRAAIVRHVIGEVNPLKSRLISLVHELENAGAIRPAHSLDRIIGELEAWQAKNSG